jgi:predicted DNA-binding transcriptional regulator YafY
MEYEKQYYIPPLHDMLYFVSCKKSDDGKSFTKSSLHAFLHCAADLDDPVDAQLVHNIASKIALTMPTRGRSAAARAQVHVHVVRIEEDLMGVQYARSLVCMNHQGVALKA